MALNKVMLIGNVGKDPEVRYLETPEHPKVAQFTLATSERYKAKDGSVTEQTEWHNIVAWRGLADIAEKYIRKGSSLYVEGRLRTRSWKVNGQNAYRTEILVDRIQMLGGRSEASGQRPETARPGMPARTEQDLIYDNPSDDLPF